MAVLILVLCYYVIVVIVLILVLCDCSSSTSTFASKTEQVIRRSTSPPGTPDRTALITGY